MRNQYTIKLEELDDNNTPTGLVIVPPFNATHQLDKKAGINKPMVEHITMSGNRFKQALPWEKHSFVWSGSGTEDPQIWQINPLKNYKLHSNIYQRRIIKCALNETFGLVNNLYVINNMFSGNPPLINGLDITTLPDNYVWMLLGTIDRAASEMRYDEGYEPHVYAEFANGSKEEKQVLEVVDPATSNVLHFVAFGITLPAYVLYNYCPIYYVSIKPFADPDQSDRGGVRRYTWSLEMETL